MKKSEIVEHIDKVLHKLNSSLDYWDSEMLVLEGEVDKALKNPDKPSKEILEKLSDKLYCWQKDMVPIYRTINSILRVYYLLYQMIDYYTVSDYYEIIERPCYYKELTMKELEELGDKVYRIVASYLDSRHIPTIYSRRGFMFHKSILDRAFRDLNIIETPVSEKINIIEKPASENLNKKKEYSFYRLHN